jgi:hypothetical protein
LVKSGRNGRRIWLFSRFIPSFGLLSHGRGIVDKKEWRLIMNVLKKTSWSSYVAGGLVGILLCLSVLITGKYLGASTTFVRSAGLIEKIFVPDRVAKIEYFVKKNVKIDWQWMFVVGIFFGSLLASKISGDYRAIAVQPMWEKRFGPDKIKRWGVAFLGGIVLMFGARMAGG